MVLPRGIPGVAVASILVGSLTIGLAVGAGAEARRALVSAMAGDGPAQPAGLQLGDAIICVDGASLVRDLELTRTVPRRPIGATNELTIAGRGPDRRFAVTTEEEPVRGTDRVSPRSPTSPDDASPDLDRAPVSPAVAHAIGLDGRERAVVSRVREGAATLRAGFRLVDVIVEADHRAMRGPEELWCVLSDDDIALLRLRRGDHAFHPVLRRK